MTVQLKHVVAAAAGVALVAFLAFGRPWSLAAQTAGPSASNALLTCEPSQQVVVRHVAVQGELQLSMQCVGTSAAAYQPIATQPVRMTRAVSAPVAPVRSSTPVRYVEPRRSWKKTALVIGGSTGAGAGIGAIAGGKKGALIGAAIGGGAASLFEAIKRRE